MDGWTEEQDLTGLKGRAIQPQDTYTHQPEVRVSHGHFQNVFCHHLVKVSGFCHYLHGSKDDVCPLRRREVPFKGLCQEGMEQRHVPPSTLMVRLSWVE